MHFLSTFCLAVSMGVICFSGSSIGQTPPSEAVMLQPGKTLEREISGTQKHRYKIEIAAGQAITVTAKETGIDLGIQLLDANSRIIAGVDVQNSPESAEAISLVAESEAKTFDIGVSTDLVKAGPSGYSMIVSDARPATANDIALYKAFLGHSEATRILNSGTQVDKVIELASGGIDVRTTNLGPDHPLTGESMIVLGRAYASKGDFAQSDKTINAALKVYERSSGKDSIRYAQGLLALALSNFARGDMKSAEAQMLESIAILEKTRDAGGLRTATVLANLGLIYRTITDFRRAELSFRRAIDILDKLAGEDNIAGVNVRNNLGLMYYGAGDYVNAEKELERSLAAAEKVFGPEHREVAIRLNNLGLVAWRKQDHVKAEAIWQRALKIFEKVNGPESDGVANVLGNLGIIFKEYYKDFRKAEEVQKRSLAIIQKLSGENSLQAGTATASLSLAYFDRGPISAERLVSGGTWSAYWYNGYIYSSEIARGLDVLELSPSKFLTQNEIDAAKQVRVAELNVQNQERIVWPQNLTTAKAYVDQLERSKVLSADQVSSLRSDINKSDEKALKKHAGSMKKIVAKDANDMHRLKELSAILEKPAK